MHPKSISRRPDFLVIGAQKAGTTWLHKILSAHPEFWMPPAKELHYFDHKFALNTPNGGLPPTMEMQRKRVLVNRLKRLNIPKAWALLKSPNIKRLVWELEYTFGKRTDEWYCNLFRQAGKSITGDITPDYSRLGADAVKYVHSLLPDARIILLLRNPIERAWSHAIMDLVRHRGHRFEHLNDSQLIAHFESRASRLRTSYIDILNRWQDVYGQQQLFVGFFDQISEDPASLIDDICQFLCAQTGSTVLPEKIYKQKVNLGVKASPSKVCLRHLEGMYGPMIDELGQRFGKYPEQWKNAAGMLGQ